MDGLGLVYEKQGNTGAAAYNQPSLQYGQTPLDAVAQNIEQQNLIKQQQEFQLAKQREKEKAAVLGKLGDINLSKFTLGNQQEFMGDILNHKNQIAADMSKGEDVTDPTSPAYARTYERQLALQNKKMELDKQGAIIEDAMKILQTKPDDFDVEKSAAAIKAYAEAPNATERMKIDPSTLLVRKEVPFDTYTPLKDFDINPFVVEQGYETEEMKRTGNYLDVPKLKAKIKSMVDNPVNEEHYQKGLAKGLWGNKSEYEKALFEQAKLDYTKKSFYERKAPKEKTFIEINNGNTKDMLSSLGAGTQSANVPINNTSMMVDVLDENGKPTGEKKKATTDIDIPNTVNLGNFNQTIPMGSAISTTTGKRLSGTGAMNITSGVIGTPLIYKSDGRPVPLGVGVVKYQKDGVWKEAKGTKEEITKQLVADGVAEHKPMVLAIATTTDPNDASKNINQSVWVDADAVIPSTGESKTLTRAQAAGEILKKAAKELNSVGITPPKVTNKQIKKSDIATKAQAAGYTVDEYTKLLKSKNIEIVD